jgi:NAD-dependent deacetylase
MTAVPEPNLIKYITQAQRIMIFTGAGISTGSGIPDYRGPEGVWKYQQPVYYQDFMESEGARIEYWDQKLAGWEEFKSAQPNPVHLSIAELENAGKIEMVVTQNIDGLHGRAGTSPEKLVELHGTNLETECQSCYARSDPDPHFEKFKQTGCAPICEKCGGHLKPATISFGQSLREQDLIEAGRASENADLVISLGSTLSVHPAASFPAMAAQRGMPYIIINRGPTDHDALPSLSLRLEGDVVAIFPPAVAAALTASE